MKIGIVGLGYVGLPLGVAFAEAGHEVVGLDTDARRIAAVQQRERYIEDISSERVDPGRIDFTLRNTPKVIAGLTPACAERAVERYRPVCDNIVEISTLEAAELTKLLENVFRSVNIAMVNELAMLCDRMGI